MDKIIPPLRIKILLESNPLKSRILVRRLAIRKGGRCEEEPRALRSDSRSATDTRSSVRHVYSLRFRFPSRSAVNNMLTWSPSRIPIRVDAPIAQR